jgi:hypothetical protein
MKVEPTFGPTRVTRYNGFLRRYQRSAQSGLFIGSAEGDIEG